LAGNPSDAYGGAAVAVPMPTHAATVEVVDGPEVGVVGPASEEAWADVGALVSSTARYGHEGGRRLVTAAIAALARRTDRPDDAFEVRWSTTIPRSVGLGGSSAVVVATMQALAARWSVVLDPLELAHLALGAEVDELGIAAGLMDRAVQAVGGPVLIDGDDARPLSVAREVSFVVAWRGAGAEPSQRVHGPLRARFDARESAVVSAMARLAVIGRQAAGALEAGDADALGNCVAATWDERLGLGIVGADVRAMVDALGRAGVRATSAGSGGSVVGVLPSPDDFAVARDALGDRCDDAVLLSSR
jgi:glucuronokinase